MKRKVDKEFLIWLAGFFDGEGCLSLTYYTNSEGERSIRSARLFIGQAGERGRKICEEIRAVFGGKVRKYKPKNENWKECYIWLVSERDDIIRIARALLPYLRVKKEEIEEKLRILEQWKENGRHPWTHSEIELMRKYPHLPATIFARIFKNHTYESVRHKKMKLGLHSNLPPLISNRLLKEFEKMKKEGKSLNEILDRLNRIAIEYLSKREHS